jgi:hypothetical protein
MAKQQSPKESPIPDDLLHGPPAPGQITGVEAYGATFTSTM